MLLSLIIYSLPILLIMLPVMIKMFTIERMTDEQLINRFLYIVYIRNKKLKKKGSV